jgi:hypothetical protein
VIQKSHSAAKLSTLAHHRWWQSPWGNKLDETFNTPTQYTSGTNVQADNPRAEKNSKHLMISSRRLPQLGTNINSQNSITRLCCQTNDLTHSKTALSYDRTTGLYPVRVHSCHCSVQPQNASAVMPQLQGLVTTANKLKSCIQSPDRGTTHRAVKSIWASQEPKKSHTVHKSATHCTAVADITPGQAPVYASCLQECQYKAVQSPVHICVRSPFGNPQSCEVMGFSGSTDITLHNRS